MSVRTLPHVLIALAAVDVTRIFYPRGTPMMCQATPLSRQAFSMIPMGLLPGDQIPVIMKEMEGDESDTVMTMADMFTLPKRPGQTSKEDLGFHGAEAVDDIAKEFPAKVLERVPLPTFVDKSVHEVDVVQQSEDAEEDTAYGFDLSRPQLDDEQMGSVGAERVKRFIGGGLQRAAEDVFLAPVRMAMGLFDGFSGSYSSPRSTVSHVPIVRVLDYDNDFSLTDAYNREVLPIGLSDYNSNQLTSKF